MESEQTGLFLNNNKTKIMVNEKLEEFKVGDDKCVEVVDNFVFLGSKIYSFVDCGGEI